MPRLPTGFRRRTTLGHPHQPTFGDATMHRTLQCPQCGVVLNVPEAAVGRRLKCPKCGNRFGGGPANGVTPPPPAGPAVADARMASATNISAITNREAGMPLAEGDLRETFELSTMQGEAGLPVGDPGGGPSPGREAADAIALFNTEPAPRHPRNAAEGRKQARRCPTCGGVVPIGMSICSSCGLDLETGRRILDDFEPAAPMTRRATMPIGVGVVGGISFLVALLLFSATLVKWAGGLQGAPFLAAVCAFGVYAAVQFLRSKSVKLLVIALTFGAVFDVIAMIGMPIYNAQRAQADVVALEGAGNLEDEGTGVARPITELLDLNLISWGIALLLAYAAIAVYLNSPPVRRHFHRI